MYNFQIKTSFVNLNPLARKPGSDPASTIYFILFTWASPYGTHMEPGCTAHMGAHMGPIWVPYRLLAGRLTEFMGRNCYGPKLTWAEIDMGRFCYGPK